jgi:putative aminopeptidase FrvX
MKNLTVIDAINDLIKGVNVAYSRQAYTMSETRDIINAIEFLNETIKSQQQQQIAAPIETPDEPSDK